jgi:hypothetical protein
LGYLRPGWSGTYQLAAAGGAPSLRLRCEAEQLFLSYTPQAGGEEVTKVILVVRLPWRFGGSRSYFLCPGKGAAGCGRRVLKLYLSHGHFLCRSCGQLVYASPCEKRRPWQRALRRANKLRQRLGITGLGVAEKPKGMRVADYARLLEAALQAEILATEAGTAQLLQLAARIERRRKPQFTL